MVNPPGQRPAGQALPPLLGREPERARLDELLADVRRGESRTLVVWGEPGIGKSALLAYAMQSARDLRVLRAVGVESEMELTFAALHQLCAPLVPGIDRLPAPQRTALSTVFGLQGGPAPDPFLVGLALLSLLSDAAAEQPLACSIDDAQWLDRSSAQVLGFVARRLLAEPVALLFATREPAGHLQGLPDLHMRGLDDADAHALLSSVGAALDRPIRDRIVHEARGNPLALLDIPRGLSANDFAGGFGLADALPLSTRMERAYQKQFERLSASARALLLVAAADPSGDPLLVWRAADSLGINAADAALHTERLMSFGDQVTFRHPLVRSAIYRSASFQERRAVHLALAGVTDEHADPDRRAWHRAAAAAGPDEEVAGELERSAGRAQGRGGLAAAAAFLQRATLLTGDPSRRVDRALAAASASIHAADLDAARQLLANLERDSVSDLQAARADLLRGQLAFVSGQAASAPLLLQRAARGLERWDTALARETYLTAWTAALSARDEACLADISKRARDLPEADETRVVDVLLDGVALLVTEGPAAASAALQRGVRALADLPVEDVLRWANIGSSVLSSVWDDVAMRTVGARQAAMVREVGALDALPTQLYNLAFAVAWTGDFTTAIALASEADTVAAATGRNTYPFTRLRIAALRGDEADVDALTETSVRLAASTGMAVSIMNAHWAAAVLYNSLARYEEALFAAQAHVGAARWMSLWVLPELIEAAARCGRSQLAAAELAYLSEATQACRTDWALGIEFRCRALLADDAQAESWYRRAVETLGRTQLRPETARAHLLYGEWLRRKGRRIDARAQLDAAHKSFIEIGMQAFAERARRELLATGGRARKRNDESARDELTPQERQIALLVRDGLSNPEIGAQLFLSPRTVEWHLRKVFAKLSISSRRELRTVLPRQHASGPRFPLQQR